MRTKIFFLLAFAAVLPACNSEGGNKNSQDSVSAESTTDNQSNDTEPYTGEVSFNNFLYFFKKTNLPVDDIFQIDLKENVPLPKVFYKYIEGNNSDIYVPTIKFTLSGDIQGVSCLRFNQEESPEEDYPENVRLLIFDTDGKIINKTDRDFSADGGGCDFSINKDSQVEIYCSSMVHDWIWNMHSETTAEYMGAHYEEFDSLTFKINNKGMFELTYIVNSYIGADEEAFINSPVKVVFDFLTKLSNGHHKEAYNLQTNKNWGDFEHFSANKAFGGISFIRVNVLKKMNKSDKGEIVYAEADYTDTINGNSKVKQKFYLNKIDDEWKITSMKVVDFNTVREYRTKKYKFSSLEISYFNDEGFDFYLFIADESKDQSSTKNAGCIETGHADFIESNRAVYSSENCKQLEFIFEASKVIIKETDCGFYHHPKLRFEGEYLIQKYL